MATDVLLVKELNRLAAADPISAESLAMIKQKEVVKAIITRPRNLAHHRKLFALLNMVMESQDRYVTTTQMLKAIKRRIGWFDSEMIDGIPLVELRSISFAKADQGDFEKFWEKAMHDIITEILPGTRRADIEQRVLEAMG